MRNKFMIALLSASFGMLIMRCITEPFEIYRIMIMAGLFVAIIGFVISEED